MDLKALGELNTERFLREAFEPQYREKLIRAARLRRNVYLVLFLAGFISIFVTVLSGDRLLSVLSLGLSILALVVMTKYDTQLSFLKVIAKNEACGDEA
jgi:uncharacterized membrane protein YjjP (DUF1212 family)